LQIRQEILSSKPCSVVDSLGDLEQMLSVAIFLIRNKLGMIALKWLIGAVFQLKHNML